MTENNTRDRNSHIKVGDLVSGRVCELRTSAIVMVFSSEGRRGCSGTLHLSEFGGTTRKERIKRLKSAKLGQLVTGMRVIEVTPPSGKCPFSKVRLSLRNLAS